MLYATECEDGLQITGTPVVFSDERQCIVGDEPPAMEKNWICQQPDTVHDVPAQKYVISCKNRAFADN
jgi:hypothetical protein